MSYTNTYAQDHKIPTRKKERKKTMLRRMCGYIPYFSQLGENLFQQRFEKDLV